MRNFYSSIILCLILLSSLLWGACKQNLVAPTPQTGVLKLDNYIAIGDGYSAGFGIPGLGADRNPFSNVLPLAGFRRFTLAVEGFVRGPFFFLSSTSSLDFGFSFESPSARIDKRRKRLAAF